MKLIVAILIFVCSFCVKAQDNSLPYSEWNKDFPELNYQTIFELEQDQTGRLWIGTNTGLYHFDGYHTKKFKFEGEKNETSENQRAINLLNKGDYVYCITSHAIYKINIYDFTSQTYLFTEKIVSRAQISDSLFHFKDFTLNSDLKKVPFQTYFNPKPKFVFDDCKLSIGLPLSLNQNGKILFKNGAILNKFLQYDAENCYAATNQGCYHLKKIADSITVTAFEISTNFETLFKDKQGNIWLGTSNKGLNLIHRNIIQNEAFSFSDPNIKQEDNSYWTFFSYKDAQYACTSKGIKFLHGKNKDENLLKITNNQRILAATEANGSLYIGLHSKGLWKYENGLLSKIKYCPESDKSVIIQIIQDNNSLYILDTKSLSEYNLSTNKNINYLLVNHDKFLTTPFYILKDKKKIFLCGVNGFKVIEAANWKSLKNITTKSAKVFTSIIPYKSKYLITTLDGFLYDFDGKEIKKFFKQETPAYGALVDEDNNIWLAGLNSIFCLRNNKIIEFNRKNGVPIIEFNQLSFFKKNDKFYFGGMDYAFCFSPKSLLKNLEFPFFQINDGIKNLSLIDKNILVPYETDKYNLEILPTLLSNQNLFIYEYFIDGKWQVLGEDLKFSISLTEGENKLKVKLRNLLGEEEKIISFTVKREFIIWKRSWFILLMIFIGFVTTLAIAFTLKYQKAKNHLRIQKESQRLNEERLKISRNLHDNIGSRLTHIISSIDIQNEIKQDQKLDNIASFARDTMSQLRETIWLVSGDDVWYSELLHRIQQYILQIKKISNAPIILRIDNYEVDFKLEPDLVVEFFRSLQELVNNAVKYSDADEILVNVSENETKLKLIVSDNGKGFDPSEFTRGSGLENLNQSLIKVHASMKIVSENGNGAQVSITFPKNT